MGDHAEGAMLSGQGYSDYLLYLHSRPFDSGAREREQQAWSFLRERPDPSGELATKPRSGMGHKWMESLKVCRPSVWDVRITGWGSLETSWRSSCAFHSIRHTSTHISTSACRPRLRFWLYLVRDYITTQTATTSFCPGATPRFTG